eukprot:36099-Chlamydomonas_euryale.AAC.2
MSVLKGREGQKGEVRHGASRPCVDPTPDLMVCPLQRHKHRRQQRPGNVPDSSSMLRLLRASAG